MAIGIFDICPRRKESRFDSMKSESLKHADSYLSIYGWLWRSAKRNRDIAMVFLNCALYQYVGERTELIII